MGPAEPASRVCADTVAVRDEEPGIASALIHNGGGEYLLHLRDDIPGIREPGCWSLLGGAREPGDRSWEDTVRRELREEAGLDLPALEPFAVTGAVEEGSAPASVRVYVGQWDGDPARLPLTEGVMLRWFRPDDMDRLRMHPTTRDLVRTHATGRATAPSGAVRHGAGAVRHLVGAHLYLEDPAGRVLLGLRHHSAVFAPNTWHFLAGHCEQESAVSCLVREAEEEAGLGVDPRDVEFVHALHQLPGPGRWPRLQLVFRARAWTGVPEVREPDKCLGWRWFDPAALPERVVPYTREAIAHVRAGRPYSEAGWE
ncbi:NUDIX domain-containing protein [Streptomyces sp. NPDC014764]|uniref:NUDIX domain-containing protein n=1 Tax=Streptomyces sp. NPDC014764 TaxID=3364907 RepID=UPI0036F56AAF